MTVSLRGKVVNLDSGYPTIAVETVDGQPADRVRMEDGSPYETVADSKWGGHMLPDLKVGDSYEIRLTSDFASFVSYHANGWSHSLKTGRTTRDSAPSVAAATIDKFVVLYRTKAGYLGAWSDWPEHGLAEEVARERVTLTGRPHWVAEVQTRVDPSPPTASPS